MQPLHHGQLVGGAAGRIDRAHCCAAGLWLPGPSSRYRRLSATRRLTESRVPSTADKHSAHGHVPRHISNPKGVWQVVLMNTFDSVLPSQCS